jgi:hypothetical protein
MIPKKSMGKFNDNTYYDLNFLIFDKFLTNTKKINHVFDNGLS